MINANNADVYTDFSGLAQLKTQAKADSGQSPEVLKEVAKQFESVFLNLVLKSMREAKLSDGMLDSDQSRFYRDMYDQQLAIHLSGDPGVGLADLMVRQLGGGKAESNPQVSGLDDYINHPVQQHVPAELPVLPDPETVENPAVIEMRKIMEKPIHSASQFVDQLWSYADQAAQSIGVDPKVLLAQAALETGWGKAVIKQPNGNSSYNLFNIKSDKSWKGDSASVNTLEYEQGVASKQRAQFRTYSGFQESFQDYVDFIKQNPRYAKALQKAGNAKQYVVELQRAGYATDPKYAKKIMQIYNSEALSGYQDAQALAQI